MKKEDPVQKLPPPNQPPQKRMGPKKNKGFKERANLSPKNWGNKKKEWKIWVKNQGLKAQLNLINL